VWFLHRLWFCVYSWSTGIPQEILKASDVSVRM